jgi:hypothetical protein
MIFYHRLSDLCLLILGLGSNIYVFSIILMRNYFRLREWVGLLGFL